MLISDAYARGRPNSLNAIRLLLALGVIVWHSFPLSGTPFGGGRPLGQLMGYGFVDGFFAISGFLIVRSWLMRPSAASFLAARSLRILPAFWVCLLVTACVFAPLSTVLAGGSVVWSDAGSYVIKNWALWIFQYGIDGTLQGVPYPDVWNGSLWTLSWEFVCYLVTLALGLLGLWKRNWAPVALFCALWILCALHLGGLLNSQLIDNALRFALVFSAGSLLARYQQRLPVSLPWIVTAFALLAVSAWLPDYRLLAAPALAYGLVGLGGVVSHRRLQLKNDVSYGVYVYAFPLQQLLASAESGGLGVAAFCIGSSILTIPFAAASWFLVERPALRLKGRIERSARVRDGSRDGARLTPS